ncbi:MAG: hypothetical protein QXO80_02860 [Thermosphaera sp.]
MSFLTFITSSLISLVFFREAQNVFALYILKGSIREGDGVLWTNTVSRYEKERLWSGTRPQVLQEVVEAETKVTMYGLMRHRGIPRASKHDRREVLHGLGLHPRRGLQYDITTYKKTSH